MTKTREVTNAELSHQENEIPRCKSPQSRHKVSFDTDTTRRCET